MLRFDLHLALPALLLATTPAVAKSAFEHHLTLNCPSKKAGMLKAKRFSTLDLALKTVHAKADPKDEMTFQDLQDGKKPPEISQQMIDDRVASAYAEFDKALIECQQENDWTDDEREFAREHAISAAGLYRSNWALGRVPDDTMFAHYNNEDLTQADADAMFNDTFDTRPVFATIINDLAASEWAKELDVKLDFNDPYTRSLVADVFKSRTTQDMMKQQFDQSAEQRFGEQE
ncbi:MAG: hypothetical protein WA793_02825 [Sphingorhabdus sp.]|uniref:hypothetical protein n=1 Tax=Sphingorhabdus sp. TaxID=1902408 RepID=UPI003CC36DD0